MEIKATMNTDEHGNQSHDEHGRTRKSDHGINTDEHGNQTADKCAAIPDGTRDLPGLWIEQTEGPRRAWTHEMPFFAFAPGIRRVISTTNVLESVHTRLRKILRRVVIFLTT